MKRTKQAAALALAVLLALCIPAAAQEGSPAPTAQSTPEVKSPAAQSTPKAEPSPVQSTPEAIPSPTAVALAVSTPAPYQPLKKGDEGEAVRALQQRLSDLGYRPGTVDGIYGGATYDAVRRLQITLDLKQSGSADADLQTRLFAEDAPAFNRYVSVRKGQSSVRVEDMQERLKALDYPYVKVTGSYDSATVKAVHLFQGDNGYDESESMSSAQLQKLYGSAKSYKRYVALSKGDSGLRVELMQQRLKKLGYLGKVSGKYNNTTKEAVKAFQENAGLKANGKASAKTLRKLFGKNAPKKDDAPQPTPVS